MQAYTSEKTARKQIPGLYLKAKALGEWIPGSSHVDIGSGPWGLLEKTLREKEDVKASSYDPFNLPYSHNRKIAKAFDKSADSVSLCNVLNVIAEPLVRKSVLELAKSFLEPGGNCMISVYEGNKSGEGQPTRDGWQENRKLYRYMLEIQEVFPIVEIKGGIILAREYSPQ